MLLVAYNYTLYFIFYILIYYITQEMWRELVKVRPCQLYIKVILSYTLKMAS